MTLTSGCNMHIHSPRCEKKIKKIQILLKQEKNFSLFDCFYGYGATAHIIVNGAGKCNQAVMVIVCGYVSRLLL